jgi:hypothetical protein
MWCWIDASSVGSRGRCDAAKRNNFSMEIDDRWGGVGDEKSCRSDGLGVMKRRWEAVGFLVWAARGELRRPNTSKNTNIYITKTASQK